MSGYGIFAQYYDKLTNNVGYDKQAEYLLRPVSYTHLKTSSDQPSKTKGN